jgi:hypothetical protein
MTPMPPGTTKPEDAQVELMTRDQWLQRLGFQFNPFEYEAADELEGGDPHLDQFFVPFPYFEELKSARSSVLFTQQGCGKSANRLQLERWCEETLEKPDQFPQQILAVRHDDFLTILADISLARHVEAILRRAVPALLETAFRFFVEAINDLSAIAREDLSWFVQHYSDRLIPSSLRKQLKEIGATRAKVTAQKAPKLTQGALDSISSLFKQKPIDAIQQAAETLIELLSWEFDETEAAKWLRTEPLELMRRFVEVAHQLGIEQLLVMVDRVDEFQGTAGKPERQTDLLRPLLANAPARGIWCFKLFLPLKLLPVLREKLGPDEFREDKTQVLEVEWKAVDIATLLQARLSASSQGRYSSFAPLVQGEPADVDEQLVQFAHHSPRDLVRLCNRIFAEHTRVPTNKLYLEPSEIQAARRWFSKARAREMYGDERLAQLIRLSEMPFTADALRQALKMNEKEADELLQDWQEKALVVRLPRDPAQPETAALFDIADPRARLIWEEEHL